MILRELVSTMPPRQKIRLGTSDGYGFVYKGQVYNIVKNCKLIKYFDREVIDVYQGIIEPDQTVIIIHGAEKGTMYNPKMPRLTTKNISDDAVNRIVGGTYREIAHDLLYAYEHKSECIAVKFERDVLEAKLKQIQERLDELKEELVLIDFERIEQEIMDVPFGKGEMVLNECRAIAAREGGNQYGETY